LKVIFIPFHFREEKGDLSGEAEQAKETVEYNYCPGKEQEHCRIDISIYVFHCFPLSVQDMNAEISAGVVFGIVVVEFQFRLSANESPGKRFHLTAGAVPGIAAGAVPISGTGDKSAGASVVIFSQAFLTSGICCHCYSLSSL